MRRHFAVAPEECVIDVVAAAEHRMPHLSRKTPPRSTWRGSSSSSASHLNEPLIFFVAGSTSGLKAGDRSSPENADPLASRTDVATISIGGVRRIMVMEFLQSRSRRCCRPISDNL